MTVAELIKKLGEFPPDALVYYEDSQWGPEGFASVIAMKQAFDDGWPEYFFKGKDMRGALLK